jgi:hypothetical protein
MLFQIKNIIYNEVHDTYYMHNKKALPIFSVPFSLLFGD